VVCAVSSGHCGVPYRSLERANNSRRGVVVEMRGDKLTRSGKEVKEGRKPLYTASMVCRR